MTLDWQTIIVAILIIGALAYVGRRVVIRARAFTASKAGSQTCETGCGTCGESKSMPTIQTSPLIHIKGVRTNYRRIK